MCAAADKHTREKNIHIYEDCLEWFSPEIIEAVNNMNILFRRTKTTKDPMDCLNFKMKKKEVIKLIKAVMDVIIGEKFSQHKTNVKTFSHDIGFILGTRNTMDGMNVIRQSDQLDVVILSEADAANCMNLLYLLFADIY